MRAGNIGPVTLTAKVSFLYSQTLVAFGGLTSPYTYSVTTGTLPSWATLTAAGLLSGTPGPSDLGSTTFTVTANDGMGHLTKQVYNLVVYSPLTVFPASSTALAIGTVGNFYNQTISATGGTPSYTFVVTGGVLPTGLTLNHSTGILSGMPTTAGFFNFIITATDTNSDSRARITRSPLIRPSSSARPVRPVWPLPPSVIPTTKPSAPPAAPAAPTSSPPRTRSTD